jgi:hypothetical protein
MLPLRSCGKGGSWSAAVGGGGRWPSGPGVGLRLRTDIRGGRWAGAVAAPGRGVMERSERKTISELEELSRRTAGGGEGLRFRRRDVGCLAGWELCWMLSFSCSSSERRSITSTSYLEGGIVGGLLERPGGGEAKGR